MGKTRVRDAGDLDALRRALLRQRAAVRRTIAISTRSGCCGSGGAALFRAFQREVKKRGLAGKIAVRQTGCHGFCEKEPTALVLPDGVLYLKVSPADAGDIVAAAASGKTPVERLLYRDPETGAAVAHEKEIPFYAQQQRTLLDANRLVDPMDIDDYIAIGGYAGLAKVLTGMSPQDVIESVTRAGLRGRGGGGFPTGRKWQLCRNCQSLPRYVICNADEGDPGAYMDRSLLEGNPHLILEGMLIGAYAVGSSQGFVYVRNEYPLALKHLTVALKQAQERGLVGEGILGTDFAFTVDVMRGGGAFVCGESTALMASLEGRAGEPRAKYVHTVEKGLYGQPTVLNNVETWANVPLIINKGWQWYAQTGSKASPGTKIFSLVGKVNTTGLVEVPLGMTLRQIIFGIGGGIRGHKRFKAVQTGGPSGGCLPEQCLDLPVDFDTLTESGSMMGSGGMIVMDEDTCMVDVARYFVRFLQEESCGKCVPCREGLRAMEEVLTRITAGNGTEEDLRSLEDLSALMKDASLCALGTMAPNPVLTTMRYFGDEYLAHIREKRCPAGVCRDLVQYEIDAAACTGCTACSRVCPSHAIQGEKKKPHVILQDRCLKCGACFRACRFGAVKRG